MEVGHKEITVVIVLNGNKFSQCAEVIAQMKVSGGAYAAEYYFFLFRHDGSVLVYVVLELQRYKNIGVGVMLGAENYALATSHSV